MSTVEKMDFVPAFKLSKDLAQAARDLSAAEARFLVDSYYGNQKHRIELGNQIAAAKASGEPFELMEWMFANARSVEASMKRALDEYSSTSLVGDWSKSITGIGPVLAAGLMAHIDIEKAPTVGHIWSFAGLNPEAKWDKGKRRPWNARLKVLTWKIGQSFIKVSGNPNDTYGKVYLARKEWEMAKNEAGDYAPQAAYTLETKRIGKTTEAYKAYSAGKLPQSRIILRAARRATKLFLSHWHHVAYRDFYGVEPPKPYILEHAAEGQHVHFLAVPDPEGLLPW